MSAATRKASERQRRAARGEVALSGWLSASDHAALTQMARDAGMTQAQVVGRLIGMRAAVLGLERFTAELGWDYTLGMARHLDGDYVRHSDLAAAVGL